MSAFTDLGYREPVTEPAGIRGRCAMPACTETPPAHCTFCATHHFALPPDYARAVLAARARAERAATPERRAAAAAEHRDYVKSCITLLSGVRS